jgi:hypothetical protein
MTFLNANNSNSNEGDSYVRSQAKAESTGSTTRRFLDHGRFGLVFACLVALCAFLGSSAPAFGAVPAKSVTGFFGATGSAGGQLNGPRGTGVNQGNGNVYTVDGTNNRVSVFNSSGTFLRAFGQDVVESGPDNNGTGYEICVAANGDVCKAGITGATGGALNGPQGLAVDQTTGNVYVTDGSNQRVQQYDANGTFLRAFGQDVVESGPGNSPAANAVQSLNVTATAGKYTLSFGGKTTPELAFNATAAEIQTALLALTSIGAGNVEVTGASMPYTITFKGALANNFEPVITVASGVGAGNELEGGTASVATVTPGSSGFEVCVAANGDVCKAGVTASTGGALKSTFNGYPAVAPVGSPNAGDVLVADPANLRVQEYTSAGAFVRAFGFDVVAAGPDGNGTAFEVCTAAKGDACKIGITGAGAGQFVNSVNRVAEDAAGNLYTVESGTPNFRVQKFTLPGNVVTPGGSFSEANLKGSAATNAPLDVAIDPSTSDVLVTKAFVAGATPSCPNTGVASVAERRIVEVSSAGALEATHMTCAGINVVNGIAVRGSTGDVYVASTTTESRLYVLNAPLTAPTVGFTGISGVTAHTATVNGFVNPNGPALAYGLTTGYHINYKRSTDSTFTAAPAADVNVGKGTTNQVISQQLVGLEANTTYEIQIVGARPFNGGNASTSIFTFTTPAVGPEVSTPTSTTGDPTGTVASLYGFVNPNSQAATYRFEYGLTSSYGSSAPPAGASAGSGANAAPVAQTLTGLQPNTTYHFRLRANNATGGVTSSDQTFTTADPADTALPDNRGLEIVSPPDKRPAGYVKPSVFESNLSWSIADNGQSAAYVIQNGLPDATTSGDVLYKATREADGWHSTQVSPPSIVPSVEGAPSNTLGYSPNLTCNFVETNSPLTDDVPQGDIENNVGNLYRENEDGSFTLITTQEPINPTSINGSGYFVYGGSTSDCGRVVFTSSYLYAPGQSGLYEWDHGVLRDAGIRPDGTIAPTPSVGSNSGPILGNEENSVKGTRYNSVSEDARRIFFTSVSNEGGDKGQLAVFVRQNGATTVDASKPTTATLSLGGRYEMASPDGRHVFFRSNVGLAGPAGSAPQEACVFPVPGTAAACDLYDYNTETGSLTDLTADFNQQDPKGAAVQGVAAVSKDGSYVYFAAKGQLVPGAGTTFAENNGATKRSNIYVSHNGQLSFVATVLDQDLEGKSIVGSVSGKSILARNVLGWDSYTTPSGKFFVFESRSNVTGYDSGSNAEAYLYSVDAGTTACVSCRANGQQSPYALNPGENAFTFVLPGQAAFSLGPRGLHYNRPMSDDGQRIFFVSSDALALGAVQGTRNVYEWENGRVRLLATSEGRLIGTSTSGDDVFFTSFGQLVTQDFDHEADLYDARVNGGFPPLETTVPCEPAADQCQGLPAPQPGAPNVSSEGFSGAGNPPIPAAPKHKKKHHKKKHKKKAGHGRKGARVGNDNRGGSK